MEKGISPLNESPLFNVLMFSAFWAVQLFVAKLGFIAGATVLPFQIVMVVTTIATLAILLLPKSGLDLAKLFKHKPSLFWKLFLANSFQAGLGTCLSIIGISLTDVINAGFLVKLTAVSTILLSWIFLKEKFTFIKVVVVVAMIFGAYLLTTKGQNLLPRVGDLFILGACFCWSLGSVLVRRFLKTQAVNADVVTLQKPLAGLLVFGALIGISVFSPAILGNFNNVLKCCTFVPSYSIYAIGSGICLAMAWIYLYRTLQLATASYMTLISMVTPIIVSVFALIFLDERLILIQIVGAGLIVLSGVAIYFSDIAYS